MPDKVTLVRHDGSLMDATPEQAGRLRILGYQEVTPEQNSARLAAESRADYYTTPGQQANTALEGIANGLDFGLSDYLMGDDDTKARAAYNPGLRASSEALGAMLPMFLTGGESAGISAAKGAEEAGLVKRLASVSPTSLLSDAAHALAPERTLTGVLARGVVEGGVYGGVGAADHAYLDGEPITAEAVLHGIGWGAIVGGGLGALGHAVEVGGEHAASAKAAEEAAARPVPHGSLNTMAGSEYGALRDEVANLGSNIKEAVASADTHVKQVTNALKKAGEDSPLSKFLSPEKPDFMQDPALNFSKDVGKIQGLYEKAAKAATAGKIDAAERAIAEYASHVNGISDKLGVPMQDVSKPLQDLAVMRNIQRIATGLPKTVEAFAGMGQAKLEATVAAFEKAKGLPFTSGLPEATENFKSALGLDVGSGDLRVAHKTARSILQSEGKTPKMPPQKSGPGVLRKAVGYAVGGKAWLAAKAAGFGRVGAYTAYRSVRDTVTYGGEHFAGIKAAALAGIREAAAAWGPSMGRAGQAMAAKNVNALQYTLFGEPDKGAKDASELAARRVAEIAKFAPVAKDAIYKAVQPIAVTQPMLAPTMHKSAMAAFQALQAMAPRDPGAISGLKSLWKPSEVQAAILAKQLGVFNDPVGVAIGMLTGNRDLVQLDALKKMAPAVYQEFRSSLIEQISKPGVLEKASSNDQIFLSVALDFPVHSRMSPGQISTGQQIFVDRNQPLKANPRMGPGGGLPNPSDKNSTQAARSTER